MVKLKLTTYALSSVTSSVA